MISNRELFLRYVAQTSESPVLLEIERAQGVRLYGTQGEVYLDMISGIAVSSVGHRAREVVEAVQQQADRFLHTMVYGEFVLAPQAQLAEELHGVLGGKLDNVYFTNSGSEAVEGALKLAKKFTGRQEILAFHHSYHGSSHGALSVTGAPDLKSGYGPFLPEVRFLQYNSWAAIEAVTENTACVIVEPIQGEAGVVRGNPCFLRALRERCYQTGTLLIFDEIQTGFGRTGHWAHFQAHGFEPDILVLAKGMGGGMPIGAFISSQEIMRVLTRDPVLGHITTFGGHPVSCAASLATLRKIRDEDLMAEVPVKEALIRSLLEHPLVREVRGKGLMFAIELGSFDQVLEVMHVCIEKGVLTDWFLNCDTAIRLAPPLVITEAELREGIGKMLEAIEKVCG